MPRFGPSPFPGLFVPYARDARFVPANPLPARVFVVFTKHRRNRSGTSVFASGNLSISQPHFPAMPHRSGNLLSKLEPHSPTLHDSTQPASCRQNFKLTLAYDGTEFSGWQIQPGERTVQGELQAAIRRVTGESPLPQGSGRTDAGVHALGQVASVELQANIPADSLQRAVNRTLPPSIRILESRMVPSTFHARHSTLAKTYEYRLFLGPVCPPFLARYVYACPWPINFEWMQECACVFEGCHNFLSFAATDPDVTARKLEAKLNAGELPYNPHPHAPAGKEGAVRTIYSSGWERHGSDHGGQPGHQPGAQFGEQAGDQVIYRVRGNGFLHHMVRNLVGTMIDVGRGYLALEAVPGILAARVRSAAGPTAPAQGLFLHSVEYDETQSSKQTE
jgi:tRNA pseudouridine38-40 synthase